MEMNLDTTFEVAVILATIYFAWLIAKGLFPIFQKNQDEKIDQVLVAIEKTNSKLDEIEATMNNTTADIRVHNVEIEHLKARMKKVEDSGG